MPRRLAALKALVRPGEARRVAADAPPAGDCGSGSWWRLTDYGVRSRIETAVRDASLRYAIDPDLLHAVIRHESNYQGIIHAHFGDIGLYGAKLKRWKTFSGKLITTFYGYDLSSYLADNGESVYDPLFSQGDLFLPISDYFNDKLLILGCPQNKILIHRLGIDIKEFDFRPRIISDKTKLLTVGRLVDKKGIDYSINAIKNIIHNRKDINIEYNVIGEGPNKKRYLEIIEKENLKDKINLLGSKTHDEVKNFMYDSHIYIQPSITALNGDKEGTPVSLMEAMSSGMPVISTFHSGIPELVENGVSGYLVEEKNHEMLMDKILY